MLSARAGGGGGGGTAASRGGGAPPPSPPRPPFFALCPPHHLHPGRLPLSRRSWRPGGPRPSCTSSSRGEGRESRLRALAHLQPCCQATPLRPAPTYTPRPSARPRPGGSRSPPLATPWAVHGEAWVLFLLGIFQSAGDVSRASAGALTAARVALRGIRGASGANGGGGGGGRRGGGPSFAEGRGI